MHDAAGRGEPKPKTAERVEWTDTRNLATDRPDRAWRLMASTARAAPHLKSLAGGSGRGRKLEKPVYHYALSWKAGETPGRQEMSRAVDESLKRLGLENHEALVVAHNDTAHRHVHVIANRVDPETGKAASVGNDRLKLANWAEDWERERGEIQCPERVANRRRREANIKRGVREYVRGPNLHAARYRRERMHPNAATPRTKPPPTVVDPAAAAEWHRLNRDGWQKVQEERSWRLRWLETETRREWGKLLAGHRRQAAELERLARGGVAGRLAAGRIAASGDWGRLDDTSAKRPGVIQALRDARRLGWREARTLGSRGGGRMGQWRGDLASHHEGERAALGQRHSASAGRIEIDLRAGVRTAEGVADDRAHKVQFGPGLERAARSRAAAQRSQQQRSRQQSISRPGPDRGGGFER